MTELLTAAQMRAIESAAIERGEVTGLELMERAGRGVVEAIFEEWPELADVDGGVAPSLSVARTDGETDERPPEYLGKDKAIRRAVVLCGPGNNGGDGFVVARLLKERGWDVDVYLYGDADKLPADAKKNYQRWQADNRVAAFTEGQVIGDEVLIVEALFGIGQTRPLPAFIQDFAAHAALMTGMTATRLVAIDMPSGIASDTGEPLGDFQFFADLTVTFHTMNPCHVDEEGCKRCGKVVVKDIGL